MARNGGGVIVIVSSVAAQVGFPELGLYCASQAALVGMARALAVELAPEKIRINTLLPSTVQVSEGSSGFSLGSWSGGDFQDPLVDRTLSFQPIAKSASAEEIAEGICFLASPTHTVLTGATLVWDGGLSSV